MLGAVLDALADPVIVTDSRWRIVLVYQGTLTAFRYERPELLGRRLDVLLPAAAPGAGCSVGGRTASSFPSRSGPGGAVEVQTPRDRVHSRLDGTE